VLQVSQAFAKSGLEKPNAASNQLVSMKKNLA
jgi:hypothetical protein